MSVISAKRSTINERIKVKGVFQLLDASCLFHAKSRIVSCCRRSMHWGRWSR